MVLGLLVVAVCTAVYALFARRLGETVVTAPVVFLALGATLATTGLFRTERGELWLHLVAEIALIVLLFLDAAQIRLAALRRRHTWPVRMLVLGLPLSIAIGTLVAWWVLPGWPLAAAALLAAILAPTDAALGQAVVSNPLVPERVRNGLTVESGLNDGLALPAVLLFASIVAGSEDAGASHWLWFGAKQVVLGPLVGAVVGLLGGRMLLFAKERDLTAEAYEGVGAIAMASACYLAAVLVGGNGFIAAFVGGLAFGHVIQGQCKFVYEFTENEGQLLSWGAFLLLGLLLVPESIEHLDGPTSIVILSSLFVVRPVAIGLSLLGTDASPVTRLFFGWFGPRGLATALFALLILDDLPGVFPGAVLAIAINAVWMSAVLHGATAVPAARYYAAFMARRGQCPETEELRAPAKPLPTWPT